MSEQASEEDRLRRQILLQLRNWRSAGVEWLPRPELIEAAESKPAPEAAVASPKQEELQRVIPVAAASLLDAVDDGAEAGPSLTLDERRIALGVLAEEVKGCTRCAELCSIRRQTVFGDGQPKAEVCFIGEAPGEDEDIQGIPFVGAAGQLLNRILTASGLKREEVYICNIVKCHPPRNRTPLADEAANCAGYLARQLELVQPKYLVALGGCAATNLLKTTLSVGKLRGRFHDYRGIPVMVTYHPSYLLPHRDPSKKREVWDDMKMLLKKMGREVPQK